MKALWLHGAGAGAQDAPFDKVRTLLDGAEIIAPQLGEPEAAGWGDAIADALDALPPEALLIGHSFGASMLLKVLAERRPHRPAPALFGFAPPWWGPEGWGHEDFHFPDDAAAALDGVGALNFYHGTADDVVEPAHSALYARAFPRARCQLVDGADHVFAGAELSDFAADLARAGLRG